MSRIELDSKLEATLEQIANERGCTVAEVIGAFLAEAGKAAPADPLVAFTASAEFRVKASDAERYLALLAWIARHHEAEFSDFITHLESGRRYVGMSPEEVRQTCQHNQARQVPGTRYWAIMNLDTPTKRRFLRRLLVFVGAPDEVIAHVAGTIGRRLGG